MRTPAFTALDFFAGSGLVTEGLGASFRTIWANDICPKKSRVYRANHGGHTLLEQPIQEVSGGQLPAADLAWGSFPCQDLSLAGRMRGMDHGERSSLFYEWLRVLDEMSDGDRPKVLCAENVVGFLVADKGGQFKLAYGALKQRGYRAGALVLDAARFVPQSRPRSFLIAVGSDLDVSGLRAAGPGGVHHTNAVMTAYRAVNDPDWIWWRFPEGNADRPSLSDICEFDAPCDPPEKTKKLFDMVSPRNWDKLREALESGVRVGAGYKRVRVENGVKRQRFEIRFDGLAGCLRTPNGGSSRQHLVLLDSDSVRTRLLTPREAARLMGAPESYVLPDKYNDAYWAMGDAVAVPVTARLAEHLLAPLAACVGKARRGKTSKCA